MAAYEASGGTEATTLLDTGMPGGHRHQPGRPVRQDPQDPADARRARRDLRHRRLAGRGAHPSLVVRQRGRRTPRRAAGRRTPGGPRRPRGPRCRAHPVVGAGRRGLPAVRRLPGGDRTGHPGPGARARPPADGPARPALGPRRDHGPPGGADGRSGGRPARPRPVTLGATGRGVRGVAARVLCLAEGVGFRPCFPGSATSSTCAAR